MKTALLYDLEMLLHSQTDNKPHPECPARILSILNRITSQGLLKECKKVISKVKLCTEEDINLIHPIEYIKSMIETEKSDNFLWLTETYMNSHSYKAAKLGIGAFLEGIEGIFENKWENCFAIIRPPGHHCGEFNHMKGYCFFNNVAIATKYAQQKIKVKKILILDWDVHHGDGTQHIFYDDPSVLYISLHRYDCGNYYPGESGDSNKIVFNHILSYYILY